MKLTLAALLLFSSTASAAELTLCRSVQGRDGQWWSWRLIDGKRCWFPGRTKAKSELRWATGVSAPPPPRPSEEPPQVSPPAPVTPMKAEAEDLGAVCCWPDLATLEAEVAEIIRSRIAHKNSYALPIVQEPKPEPSHSRHWLLVVALGIFAAVPYLIRKIQLRFTFKPPEPIVTTERISEILRRIP